MISFINLGEKIVGFLFVGKFYASSLFKRGSLYLARATLQGKVPSSQSVSQSVRGQRGTSVVVIIIVKIIP